MLTLHDGHDRIAEEKSTVEIEGEKALPLVEREGIDGGPRVGNDSTAPDSVHQNINATTCRHSLLHYPRHIGRLQCIGHQAMSCAARAAYPIHNLRDSGLVEVHPHHGAAFSPDHLRRSSSYTTSSSRDQGNFITESHCCLSFALSIHSVHGLVSQDIFLAPINHATKLF